MSGTPQRLNDADAMYLAVEEVAGVPVAPLSISVAERPHAPGEIDHLREVFARLLPAQRRRIVRDRWSTALPRWEDVPRFDPSDNELRLPPPGDGSLRAILDWAAEWSRHPMDPNKPPWRSVIFEGVTWDGVPGRVVTVSQTHHAVIDGQGAKRLGEQLLQWAPDGPMPDMPPPVPVDTSTRWELWKQGLAHAEGEILATNGRRAGRWLRWAGAHPRAGATRAREWGRALGRVRTYQAGTAKSPLLRRSSTASRFDLVEIDWPAFRAGGKAVGASVNDAFMGALLIGMHQYHLDHGIQLGDLRTAMAINTRREADGFDGNRVTGVMLDLPLHDHVDRAIKECAAVWRNHRDDLDVLRIVEGLRALANRLPRAFAVGGIKRALGEVDLQISNVNGIPVRHWVAGVETLWSMSFAIGGPAVSMTLISSAGGAQLSICSCPDDVKDPERLAQRIAEGFEAVADLAR